MDILKELKTLGVEITDEIKAKLDGDFVSREEMDKKVKKAETDRDEWKKKAETSEETLKGFEGKDYEQITKDRDEWKKKYEDLDKAAKEKAAEDEKNALLDEAFKEIKFSSKAAGESIRNRISESVSVKDGKLIGFNDLLEAEKENDSTAFVTEEDERKAKFGTHSEPGEEPISGDPNTMDFETYRKWRKQNS